MQKCLGSWIIWYWLLLTTPMFTSFVTETHFQSEKGNVIQGGRTNRFPLMHRLAFLVKLTSDSFNQCYDCRMVVEESRKSPGITSFRRIHWARRNTNWGSFPSGTEHWDCGKRKWNEVLFFLSVHSIGLRKILVSSENPRYFYSAYTV